MTEQEYKTLQQWCQSNKKNPNYAAAVEYRNIATSIRRQICFYKDQIKKSMFTLEACKTADAIIKWTNIVNEQKALRDKYQKQFTELEITFRDASTN